MRFDSCIFSASKEDFLLKSSFECVTNSSTSASRASNSSQTPNKGCKSLASDVNSLQSPDHVLAVQIDRVSCGEE